MLIEMLRDEHRRYIPLPTPDEVRAQLASFQPVASDWRALMKVVSRSKAAKATRQLHSRTPFGTSLKREEADEERRTN